MSGATDEKTICVAQIGAAHGVRGEVRLKSFTADPMALTKYGPLSTQDGARTFDILALRPAKEMLIARLSGVEDRDAAQALTHLRLYVPRARLPAIAEPDTYYHADLIGLSATAAEGTALGDIVAVHDFGAGDILEIAPAAGGTTVLVPFNAATVPSVDLAKGIVVLADPAAWFAAAPDEEKR